MRGTQQSLTVMFVIGLLSTTIGVVVGALAGFFRGRLDDLLMRFTDMIITIPVIMIGAILGVLVGGANPWSLAIALSLVSWTNMARLVRGQFLTLRERESSTRPGWPAPRTPGSCSSTSCRTPSA